MVSALMDNSGIRVRLTLDDFAKHHVLVVQMGSGHGGDEELRSVRVGASVGHRQKAARFISEEKSAFTPHARRLRKENKDARREYPGRSCLWVKASSANFSP